MKKINKQILLVTANNTEQIDLTTHPDWELIVIQPGEAAIEEVQRQGFDLVLLDKNNDSLTLKKMRAVLPLLTREEKIYEVAGVAIYELERVVIQAFEEEKRERMNQFKILDSSQVDGFQGSFS